MWQLLIKTKEGFASRYSYCGPCSSDSSGRASNRLLWQFRCTENSSERVDPVWSNANPLLKAITSSAPEQSPLPPKTFSLHGHSLFRALLPNCVSDPPLSSTVSCYSVSHVKRHFAWVYPVGTLRDRYRLNNWFRPMRAFLIVPEWSRILIERFGLERG
jgi:hypothetical protein